jgi:hypothetical protein
LRIGAIPTPAAIATAPASMNRAPRCPRRRRTAREGSITASTTVRRPRVGEQRRDVAEQHARLREVGDAGDERFGVGEGLEVTGQG